MYFYKYSNARNLRSDQYVINCTVPSQGKAKITRERFFQYAAPTA